MPLGQGENKPLKRGICIHAQAGMIANAVFQEFLRAMSLLILSSAGTTIVCQWAAMTILN